jgi:hypothetical protein
MRILCVGAIPDACDLCGPYATCRRVAASSTLGLPPAAAARSAAQTTRNIRPLVVRHRLDFRYPGPPNPPGCSGNFLRLIDGPQKMALAICRGANGGAT